MNTTNVVSKNSFEDFVSDLSSNTRTVPELSETMIDRDVDTIKESV